MLVASCVLLSSCQLNYLLKSASGQMHLLWNRKDIETVLNDPSTAPEIKRKLQLAQDARSFAETKLGLQHTKNYTSYVALDRPYVTWVISASPRDRLESHNFKFPIVGSVPYKGYFSKADAETEAEELKKQGWDIFLRGVTAYSTLGWFNDPLTTPLINRPDHELVNTIIHETVHATLYIKSESDFNERLATFIGDKGTEIYYESQGLVGEKFLQLMKVENHDQGLFSKFLSKELEELKNWYVQQVPQQEGQQPRPVTAEFEAQRQAKFTVMRERFRELQKSFAEPNNFSSFLKGEMNNARLMTYRLYLQDLQDFEIAFERHGRDFHKFLQFCKALEKSANPIQDLKTKH